MEDKLNSSWVLWYHNSNDKNWDLNSYKNIYEFNTISSFWKIINSINKYYTNYHYDMLFLMRKNNDYIYPMWEDKHNKNGGYWSFKIEKSKLNNIWIDTMILLISESLIIDDNIDKNIINGISISPKKNNCILKIWNNNNKIIDKNILNKINNVNYDEILYKSHINNIKYDKNKLNKYNYSGRRHIF